jgi:site-specific DNA-methyltransferase (adenine-specific)
MSFYKRADLEILCGECAAVMATFPAESIDLTVTSPPYDNLRRYNGYSFPFEDIAKQLFRVTKQGGVVVWVVGDATVDGSETGTSFKQALYFKEIGFNLHDTMIYEKNGASYPSGVKSVRYSNVFEFMFVLAKGNSCVHNLIKDKPNRWAGTSTFGERTNRQPDGTLRSSGRRTVGDFGYRDNIWRVNTGKGFGGDSISMQHPASFPEYLARDHILSWSNPGDVILDPMCGSGTTLKMALLNNRKAIGIDISDEYCALSAIRCINACEQGKKESV